MVFHPSKQLGQNFLVNKGIVSKIIAAAELSDKDTVLEIGPGKGVLTEQLVKHAGHVIAVEKDKRLYEILREKFKNVKNLELVNADILRFMFQVSCFKIVANIPYNITGQFFHNFLLPPPNLPLSKGEEGGGRPSMIVVMVQKEVGERLTGKNKSILSLTAELYGGAEKVCDVSPDSFSPPPKIMSSVIKLTCGAREPLEEKILHLAKIGFAARRKKLSTNLSTGLKIGRDKIKEAFDQIGLNENVRAEELALDDWLKLAEKI